MTDQAPFAVRPFSSDVAVVLGSVGAAAVLSLLYLAVAGRFLGPAEYSDFAAAVSLATLLAVALGALTPITSILSARYVADGQPARVRGLVRKLLRIVLAGAVLLFAISIVAGPYIARGLQLRSAGVLSAAILVYAGIAAASVIRAALRGSQRYGAYGSGVVAEAAVRLAAGVALLLIAKAAVLAVLPYAIGTFVASVVGLRVLRSLDPESQPVALSEVTALLGPTALLVVSMAVFQNIDVLLVKRFFSAGEAGVYGAAAGLARTMSLLLMPLETLLLPRLSYLVQRREDAVRPMAKLTMLFLLFAAVPLLLFWLVPRLIVTMVFGTAYESAAPLLLPLAAAVLLLYLTYVAGQALISVGRPGPAYAFAVAVAVEVTLVTLFHQSLLQVAAILVMTRAATLLIVLGSIARRRVR